MTSNSSSDNSNTGPTESESFDSNPSSTVITGGSPSAEQTEISGGPGPGNSDAATLDNAAPTTPSASNDNTTKKANDEELSYSKVEGDKPTGDEEIERAVAFLKKSKLDPLQKKLQSLEEKGKSTGASFEDVFENFLQMFEKLKTMWSINNAQREISQVQNKDAPDHRGHLEEVLQERNEADWMNMQKKLDEAQRSNFTSFFLPQFAKDVIASRQVGNKINDKFSEENSMFKPNQPEASKPSANKDAKNESKNESKNDNSNTSSSPSPSPSSSPSPGGGSRT